MNELLFLSLKSIYLIFLKISFLIVNQKPLFLFFISFSHCYFVVKHFRLDLEVDDGLIDDAEVVSYLLTSHWSSLHPAFPEIFSALPNFVSNFIIWWTISIVSLEVTFNWVLRHGIKQITKSLSSVESIIELFSLCWGCASHINICLCNHQVIELIEWSHHINVELLKLSE